MTESAMPSRDEAAALFTALDPALLRPGRLETHFHIPLPTPLGREDILRVHTRKVALCSEDAVDFRDLALRTEGYSGAQLKDLCTRAGMKALRERVGGVGSTSSAKVEEAATIAVTMVHFTGAL
jgi:ATP-dependent 26S proteasome regulatory subunit